MLHLAPLYVLCFLAFSPLVYFLPSHSTCDWYMPESPIVVKNIANTFASLSELKYSITVSVFDQILVQSQCGSCTRRMFTLLTGSKALRCSIRRQNSYGPRSRRCTGRREVLSRDPVNKVKKTLCIITSSHLKTSY
jgi:LSD1 subclass zinc finger protein